MKKMLILFLMVVTFQGKAQSFEGSVRWTMTMEISDPKLKAQMEEAQKQMNDPAMQEQMKQMKEQMESPEMKKMMESNPAMKAQMESAMKAAGGGGMNDMMPKAMTVKIKGENMVSIMEGGMADGMEVLHAKNRPPTRMNRAEKTYSQMPDGQGSSASQPKVTKTAETMKLLGYSCTKYIAEVKEGGTTVKQVYWTTLDIKDMDMKVLARQRMGQGGQAMYYDQLEGVPLKMEFSSPQGTMIMIAKEIKREKLSDAIFVIPADFKEVKMPGGF